MKKGIKILMALAAVFAAVAVVAAGCGSGGGGGGIQTTPITNSTQATGASSSSSQAATLAIGTGVTFGNLGGIAGGGTTTPAAAAPGFHIRAPKDAQLGGGTAVTARLSEKFAKSPVVAAMTAAVQKAKALKATQPIDSGGNVPCYDFGTYSYTGYFDDMTGDLFLTFTFAACREYDTELNGTYTLSGDATGTTVSLSGFSIKDYQQGSDYGVLVASMTANMTFNVSADAFTFTMIGNGTMTATVGGISYNLTFTNYRVSDMYTVSAGYDTDVITVNGSVSESWTILSQSYSVSVAYTNLTLTIKLYTDDTANKLWDEEVSINGYASINFTPDNYCAIEGTFYLQTTTPVYWDDTAGHTTAGVMTINGNTTITFNADGTIDVTYNGTVIHDNVDQAALDDYCEFAAI
jgi:hypothetical protein